MSSFQSFDAELNSSKNTLRDHHHQQPASHRSDVGFMSSFSPKERKNSKKDSTSRSKRGPAALPDFPPYVVYNKNKRKKN